MQCIGASMSCHNISIGNMGNRHFVSVQPNDSTSMPLADADDKPCISRLARKMALSAWQPC